jgi:LmbE family N-acetylglucosaminyl deacetylase
MKQARQTRGATLEQILIHPNTAENPFADVKRAIVVCAHADDLETMMGGTAALLTGLGVEISELICTRGDLGSHDPAYTRQSLSETRLGEAKRGAELLGVREVVVLDNPDGELEPSLELRAQIALYYRRWQPDALFTFDPAWAGQIHPDHRALGRAALDAIMPSKMPLYKSEQLEGEGVAVSKISRAFLFSPADVAFFVDVTGIYSRKVEAAMAHSSQFPEDKNLDWMRRIDSEAAKQAGSEGKYMERFARLDLW